MQTINATLVEEKQPGAQEVSLHIDNMPDGGGSDVPDGSITKDKLADGAVSTDKLADGSVSKAKLGEDVVIPPAYTLPAASKEAIGGVKQADFVPDPAGETPTKAEYVALRNAMVTSGLMASA